MRNAGPFASLLLLSVLGPAAVRAEPVVLPEGIADPAGKTGFFAGANGEVEAIDLATGKVLWHTHEAQRPIVVNGDHLLAHAGIKRNRLRVLCLDLNRGGECDLESDPVVFPAWVVTGPAHGRSFAARWQLEKHHLRLDWEASAWYAGKTRPTPEQKAAARKHASGVALIDMRSGQVEVRPAAGSTAAPPPALPEMLEKKAHRWQGVVGTQLKVLTLEDVKGFQRFVLHTWDPRAEKHLGEKELLYGRELVVRPSLDNRVLCVRDVGPAPEEKGSLLPKKASAHWWLFSVQTGELLGRLPDEPGLRDVVVRGKRAFYLVPGSLRGRLDQPSVQPQLLKVIELPGGKKLWEHPVAGRLIAPPPL